MDLLDLSEHLNFFIFPSISEYLHSNGHIVLYTQFMVSGMLIFSETFWILGTKSTDFINLWLNPHFPLLLFIIQCNPLQYLIIYLFFHNLEWYYFNYILLLHIKVIFQPFLSKFFSSYLLGMVRVDFCRAFELLPFVFRSGLGVWSSHQSWFPLHLTGFFWVVDEFGCRHSITEVLPYSYFDRCNDR